MAVSLESVLKVIAQANPLGGVEGLKADVSLSGQGIDSLDRAKLFLAVENAFNIAIPDSEYVKLTTLAELVDYLQRQGK